MSDDRFSRVRIHVSVILLLLSFFYTVRKSRLVGGSCLTAASYLVMKSRSARIGGCTPGIKHFLKSRGGSIRKIPVIVKNKTSVLILPAFIL